MARYERSPIYTSATPMLLTDHQSSSFAYPRCPSRERVMPSRFLAIGSVYNHPWKESFYHHTGSVVGPLSASLKAARSRLLLRVS